MRKVILTDAQHDALCKALGWIEAAGDYSELAESLTRSESRALEEAATEVRAAPYQVSIRRERTGERP